MILFGQRVELLFDLLLIRLVIDSEGGVAVWRRPGGQGGHSAPGRAAPGEDGTHAESSESIHVPSVCIFL